MSAQVESPGEVARAAMLAAYQAAAALVEAEPDAEAAFRLASELRATADETARGAATLRALTAARLMDSEGLTYGQLAKRLGTSKARADQLIRAARAAVGTDANAG